MPYTIDARTQGTTEDDAIIVYVDSYMGTFTDEEEEAQVMGANYVRVLFDSVVPMSFDELKDKARKLYSKDMDARIRRARKVEQQYKDKYNITIHFPFACVSLFVSDKNTGKRLHTFSF